MQVYVRLGLRKAQQAAWKVDEVYYFPSFLILFLTIYLFVARRLPKFLYIKQGIKYNAPVSAADITPFITFHR